MVQSMSLVVINWTINSLGMILEMLLSSELTTLWEVFFKAESLWEI
jgi:hypothetical protein